MNNPKPKIYNNDIKVLGRVVSIASENKVAAAEQVFDEKFKYNELPDYSFDNENIDPTQKGLNQYSINRLIGKKVKDIEEAGLLPDEGGFLNNIKIDNLTVKNGATFSGDVSFGDNVSIDKNLTVGNKITTKDLEVTNNAKINKLIVGPGEGIDVYEALTHLLQCCENMNNQGGSGQGGVTLVVSPNPINMNVGDTVEFTVKLNASGVDLVVDPEINYTASISDTSVATLIGNNKVTAVSGGTTQLTVSWNGIQKTVQINVAQPETHTYQLTLDPTSINMTVGGETRGIIATRKRDDDVVISDGTINWSSSDTSIATVDQAGTVTAHGQGNATITATWVDPNEETKTATCSVTVSVNIVQPTSLKIVGHENVTVDESTKVATVDVTDGSKTVKFKAVITPNNADTDTEITWTKLDGVGEITPDPNDNSICTYVSLDRSSVCNLKATTANGKSDQILINVVTSAPDPIYPSSIAISGANTVEVGSNITLHATVSPSNADTDNTVTWSSSDTSKATVENGVVTGVAAGNVVITAATGTGNAITATHNVEITTQSAPAQYTLTPDTNYWEFKIGQNPTTKTIRLTLNGWQSDTQWDLKRSDNSSYNEHTGIDHSDQQVSAAAQADSPTGNPITFSAWIDGSKVAETTVTIVTLPEDEPTHNTFTATFFDTGLGADETDPYVYGSNPNLEYPVGPSYYDNPVVLGTVDFTEGEPSGVWHNAKEGWPTEEEVKATCLAAGVDRTGYTLRWDSASYAGYMPNRDIYIKAVWDVAQV